MSEYFTLDEKGNRVPYNEPLPEKTTTVEETLKAPARILGKTVDILGEQAQGLIRHFRSSQNTSIAPLEQVSPQSTINMRNWGKNLAAASEIAPAYRAEHPIISTAGDIAETLPGTLAAFANPAGVITGPAAFFGGQYEKSYRSGIEHGLPEVSARSAAQAPATIAGIGAALMGPVAKVAGGLVPAARTAEELIRPAISTSLQRGLAGIAADTLVMQGQTAGIAEAEKATGARPEANAMEEVWKNPTAWVSAIMMGAGFRGLSGMQKALELRSLRSAMSNPEYPSQKRMLAAEKIQNALRETDPVAAEQFGAKALEAINNKQAMPFGLEKPKEKIINALEEKVANPESNFEDNLAKAMTEPIEKPITPGIHPELHNSLAFSVSKGIDPNVDMASTKKTEDYLKQQGIEYKRVQGVYKGTPEESFVVSNTPANAKIVNRIATKFNQDSIIHTDAEGNVKLIYNNGEEKFIGAMREVSPEETKTLQSYTFDPKSGKYFSTSEAQNATQEGGMEQGTKFQGVNTGNKGVGLSPAFMDAYLKQVTKDRKFATEENASGESAASLEAIRRSGNEPPRLRFDTRSGKGNILRGVDAVDFQPSPYEIVIQRTGRDGEMSIVSQGAKVTDSMLTRALSKYRASVEEGIGKQESTPEAGIALSNPSKKVIGLDIDGVFNINDGKGTVDPSRVIEFNKILNQNGNPDIVLGSTWRESALLKNDIAEAQAVVDSLGIKARVVGVTPDLGGDANMGSRGAEYKAWEDAYGRKYGSELVAVLDDRADLTELGPRHIKTENGLSEDTLNQLASALKPAPTLTKGIVQKTFPKSEVSETPEGFMVKTPGGTEMLVKEQSVIIMTPRERVAAEKAYGRELTASEEPIAAIELGLDTILSLTPRGVKAIDHEKWHWAEYAALSKKELDIVSKKYITEEARADAYQEYINKLGKNLNAKPANKIEAIWQKMVDFYQKVKSMFVLSEQDVFGRLAKGEMETRAPKYGETTKEYLQALASLSKTPKNAVEAWNIPSTPEVPIKYSIQDMAKSVKESKFVEDDVKPKAINAINNIREVGDQALRAFAPAARSEQAFQTQAEFRNVLGEMWNKQLQASTKLDKIMKDIRGEVSTVSSVLDNIRSQGKTLADTYFSKMPEGEAHEFMARMDKGLNQVDAPRQAIADFMKTSFDSRVQAIQELGTGLLTNIQTGEGENPFFPRYWEKGEEAQKTIYSNISKRPLEGGKAFAKQRVFDDIYAGINAGYKLVSNNPVDLFFMKLGELDRYIATHKMLQALENEGIARLVPAGEGMEQGETNILGTYGTVKRAEVDPNGVQLLGSEKSYRYAVRDDVAQLVNNYLSQNLYNNKYTGKAFSGYMNIANNLNQMQLGVGSLFHGGFTTLEAIISHAALGIKAISNGEITRGVKYIAAAPAEAWRNPQIGNKVLSEMATPGSEGISMGMNIPLIAENAVLAGARKGMDTRFQTHTTEKMFEAWSNGNKIGAVIRSPLAMVEQMARPLMEYLVPRQKFGVFADMSSYWMNEHPNASFSERRDAMQEIWNRVDSRLGQVVYDRLFVNNIAKNFVQGAIRAPGWTGGTILELSGGIKDIGTMIKNVAHGEKPNMSDRTAYGVSLVLTTMIANGLLTALFTGEAPEGKDFVAFRTGNTDEHGFEERFMLPTYMKDVLAYSEAPSTTLANKLHPAIGLVKNLATNKDYYGTEIIHEGDNIISQAAQVAGFTIKQYQPFWVRGVQKESERGGGAMALGAPFIGIMPAPSDLNRTPAERMIRGFVSERMPKTSKTNVEFERSRMLTKLTSEFRQQNPDAEKDLHEAIANGIISTVASKSIKNAAKLSPLESGFKRLSLEEARKVMERATPEERTILSPILKNKEAHAKKLYPNAEENL